MPTVSGRVIVITILAISAIVVSIAAMMLFGHPRGRIAPPPSIAVLPLTGDAGGTVAQQIIEALKTIPKFEVKDAAGLDRIDLKRLGEKLNVRTLLDGSVDQSHVTIKLINASDEFELWSHSYDRDTFRDAIARDVAAHVSLQ
jgi:TolB-like protein